MQCARRAPRDDRNNRDSMERVPRYSQMARTSDADAFNARARRFGSMPNATRVCVLW